MQVTSVTGRGKLLDEEENVHMRLTGFIPVILRYVKYLSILILWTTALLENPSVAQLIN
jgi:hypothetical protein